MVTFTSDDEGPDIPRPFYSFDIESDSKWLVGREPVELGKNKSKREFYNYSTNNTKKP